MFCRLGSEDDSRPVAATVWLKDVWILPVAGFTSLGRASTYVDLSFSSCRYSRRCRGSEYPRAASSSSAEASVEGPVLVRFTTGSSKRSKRISRSCGFELTLNSPPASLKISSLMS